MKPWNLMAWTRLEEAFPIYHPVFLFGSLCFFFAGFWVQTIPRLGTTGTPQISPGRTAQHVAFPRFPPCHRSSAWSTSPALRAEAVAQN